MELAVVADIGSTFTKAVLLDLSSGALIARSQASTTVKTGVQHGLAQAENKLIAQAQLSPQQVKLRLASSSAAGGLRMVTIGLVPELTAEAARLAALGAGARVLAVYSYKLSSADVSSIALQQPDVILLSGGADGGDTETVIHNAGALTSCSLRPPIVYAGNKNAAERVTVILGGAGFQVYSRGNVMPRLGTLQVDNARAAIRQVFFENIVRSKGLEVVRAWADNVIIPTPSAVQGGVALAAEVLGVDKLMAFDIGGATTDVYSVGGSAPRAGAHLHGLTMPHEMRTVEGDLGLRVSLPALLETLPEHELEKRGVLVTEARELLHCVESDPSFLLPEQLDVSLARACVTISASRHAGTIELLPTPMGYTGIQRGKDLSQASCVIGTGGLLSRSKAYSEILQACIATSPMSLLPTTVEPLQDKNYIFYAAGLLAETNRDAAMELIRGSLR